MDGMRAIEKVLDGRDIKVEVSDDDLVTDVLVLMKVLPVDGGEPALIVACDDSTDWITQRGMLSAAQHVVDNGSDDE